MGLGSTLKKAAKKATGAVKHAAKYVEQKPLNAVAHAGRFATSVTVAPVVLGAKAVTATLAKTGAAPLVKLDKAVSTELRHQTQAVAANLAVGAVGGAAIAATAAAAPVVSSAVAAKGGAGAVAASAAKKAIAKAQRMRAEQAARAQQQAAAQAAAQAQAQAALAAGAAAAPAVQQPAAPVSGARGGGDFLDRLVAMLRRIFGGA